MTLSTEGGAFSLSRCWVYDNKKGTFILFPPAAAVANLLIQLFLLEDNKKGAEPILPLKWLVAFQQLSKKRMSLPSPRAVKWATNLLTDVNWTIWNLTIIDTCVISTYCESLICCCWRPVTTLSSWCCWFVLLSWLTSSHRFTALWRQFSF